MKCRVTKKKERQRKRDRKREKSSNTCLGLDSLGLECDIHKHFSLGLDLVFAVGLLTFT